MANRISRGRGKKSPLALQRYELRTTDRLVLTAVNQGADAILGLNHRPLIGRTIEEVLPELRPAGCTGRLRSFASRGGDFTADALSYCPGGGHRRFDVFALQTGPRKLALMFAPSISDETSVKPIPDSGLLYRSIFENTGTATIIIEADTIISLANQEFVELSGFRKEEIEGIKSWTDFVPAGELDLMRQRHAGRRSQAEGIPRRYEFHFITRSGDVKNIFLSVDMIPGTEKSVAALLDITEKKNAEALLQKQSTAMEKSLDGVAILDEQGRYEYINQAHLRIYGYQKPDDLLGRSWEVLYDEQELDRFRHTIMPSFYATGGWRGEALGKRRDGSSFPQEVSLSKTGTGGLVCVVRDITERKRAELLQEAVYRISMAADSATDLGELYGFVHEIISGVMPARNFYIATYDEEHNLLSFPYFVDEIDSRPEPAEPGKGLTAYVLRSGTSLFCDAETDARLRASGEVELIGVPSLIWIGVPLIDGDRTIGVMVVQHYSDPAAYTLSELHMLEFVSSQVAKAINRKRTEEQLRRSEEQFRLISENVADLIAVLDTDGRRIYNSPSYRGILGDPEKLKGTDSFGEIHPGDRERIRSLFSDTVRTGIGHRAEYRFLLSDNSIRYIESQGSAVRNPEGVVTNVVVVSRDVTEQKQTEQRFLRAQRMESLGTLAAGIAHDLNNVLSPILLAMELLKAKNPDPESMRLLDTMETSAHRGSDIVKQVLAFGRGVEGERIIVQPKHIIKEVLKIAQETFPRNVIIGNDVPKNLWTLNADPTQLHQVLLNICVNSRDAMPDGGKLLITAENINIDETYARMHLDAKPGAFVLISVTDTGLGISQEIVDRIFDPFFTTKEPGKGTGLGLSTVLAIVRSHGGFVTVYSELHKGTTFKVYLPASGDEAAGIAEKSPSLPRGTGELIIAVDDEAAVREIMLTTLESFGYRVLTAADGSEAIGLYARHEDEVKLVICDMMMPVVDGSVTIRALQKINPNVVIIAASGLVQPDSVMNATNLGVKAYLAKPYTAEKLLTTIHTVLHPAP
ncbi:MAG TPA: PAS domain S-box protein [Bacteroidota bacterium]|nr:PAS domain S-box protein [Bacteroidota bacterium]